MKLNCLPDDLEHEKEIVAEKLEELFSHSTTRKIQAINKGFWLHDKQHVRVDSDKGIREEFIRFASSDCYKYINPHEALFCLESCKLLIFFNGFPLSLAEAYQLLLRDKNHFRDYRVFQQLNRTGYICLDPSANQAASTSSKTCDCSHKSPQEQPLAQKPNDEKPIEPLIRVTDFGKPTKDLLDRLKNLGPRHAELRRECELHSSTVIAFDVYKKETYTKNKPRKGKPGAPDYKLAICNKSLDKPPSCYNFSASDNLLFAVVDDDGSICFSQFKPAQCLLNDANFIHTM